MALQAVFSNRFANEFTVISGNFIDVINPDNFWGTIFTDYGNEGDETNPPTLVYANEIDYTSEGYIGILLPLSAEAVNVVSGGLLIQYRHPRWSGF